MYDSVLVCMCVCVCLCVCMYASLVAQLVKNLPVMQETWVQSLGMCIYISLGVCIHRNIYVIYTYINTYCCFSLSHVQLFGIPWTAAHRAPLSFTIYRSMLKLVSIEFVTPSNHLILCHPLLLLPSIFPSNRVFSNKSAPCIRWPKY